MNITEFPNIAELGFEEIFKIEIIRELLVAEFPNITESEISLIAEKAKVNPWDAVSIYKIMQLAKS